MAKTPGWGYMRILGELRKIGIMSVSKSTVRSILKEHGIEPAPDRTEPVWDKFLRRHASTLWSCDFFTKKVLTPRGLKRYTTGSPLGWMQLYSLLFRRVPVNWELKTSRGDIPNIATRDTRFNLGKGWLIWSEWDISETH